ncbi:NACHT domain-containing protein [Geodermatophilus sp. DSM 45219]|uniref:NACHT domain-containing protein n=1 Tax=Geodermatophilus sp. DSM 45219 TaxID=1881103 RepID=UPI00115F7C09|nr:NACHT domain-containing protein [Geodermatophilus sp. DSM 45219]
MATVAIATLGGPLLAARTALGELVKYGQARYGADGQTRDLHRQVTAGIRQWAEGERFLPEQIELGLARATEVVARFGADRDAIAKLNFDPSAVSARVLNAAKAHDRAYWGTEPHHDIAERAVEETYRALTQQLTAAEPVLLPAVLELRNAVDEHVARAEARGRRTEGKLDDLVSALVAASTAAEVMAYLQTRVADWDVSVWHPAQQAPLALERRLQVRGTGSAPGAGGSGGGVISAAEALNGQRMLVVLGGPGSGKTWLARRYAREAAQAALVALDSGANLDEVELPLLTTWDQWVKSLGSPRESLVAAAFASGAGHSDPGAGDTVDRLRRTFTLPGQRVLMVVDSLDEAADLAAQSGRLHELAALHGWRVVVTSRPAAWEATYRRRLGREDGPRIVEVQNLYYPADVEAFIRHWFAADPDRGNALIDQLRARRSLARVAVIPLILTFYCLISERTDPADRALPERSRLLYRRLVRRLLHRGWVANAPGPGAAPDVTACEAVLAQWAWSAVRDRITPTGLGNWADTFTQPSRPSDGQGQAIEAVVPMAGWDGEGGVTRRFVHRTVLEHCVAEHIATLDADTAADVLLPHLWFDPDWKVTAPAAIAAHNERQQGALLQRLLDQAVHTPADPARQKAANEIDDLLLAIAEESQPSSWTPAHQDVFHDCRARSASRVPGAVAQTAHWARSNEPACAGVLAALLTADPWSTPGLVDALTALVATAVEREQVRAGVLAALFIADPGEVARLVGALTALEPSAVEREQARARLLAALLTANPGEVADVVTALTALEPSAVEREQARAGVLAALFIADPGEVARLVGALTALEPSAVEREQARARLLAALLTANPGEVADVVTALTALEPSAVEREQARARLLAALRSTDDPWSVALLAGALPALEPTAAEQQQARAGVLAALSTSDLLAVSVLEMALTALEPTAAERQQASAEVIAALCATGDAMWVADAVEALTALVATAVEREQARAGVLAALLTADPGVVPALVAALTALEPSAVEREQARAGVLAALLSTDPGVVPALVAALTALEPSAVEQRQVRAGVLAALLSTDPGVVPALVAALTALEPTAAEREQARARLLAALPTAEPGSIPGLVDALTALVATAVEREQAHAGVLAALRSTDDPWEVARLVAALRSVSAVDSWLEWLTSRS